MQIYKTYFVNNQEKFLHIYNCDYKAKSNLLPLTKTLPKLIIGVKRQDYENRQEVASCSGLFSGTVRESATLTISYNQGTGNIVAYKGSTYKTSAAPAQVKGYENDQITIGALSPTIPNYQLVYNENQAPLNKSQWWIYNASGNNTDQTLNPNSNTFSLLKSEDGYTYKAQMKKMCNATFQNSGRAITANGINGTSSVTVPIVEQNYATVSTDYYYYNFGIDYTFSRWTKVGTSYYSPFIVTENGTYTAVYTGKPTNSGEYAGAGANVGQPIVVTWTDNPNTAVNQFQIWRKVKHNGVVGAEVLLTTLGRGIQTYVDYDYVATDGYTHDLLWYDVRAYYSTEGTYSVPDFTAAFGRIEASTLENKQIASVENELPTEYSITNYPNPFNPTTTINYQLPENGFVTIKVFDMLGKEIATLVNGNRTAGYHNVSFDASRLTSGIYIYTINAGKYTQSNKMLLMK